MLQPRYSFIFRFIYTRYWTNQDACIPGILIIILYPNKIILC